jgi:thioredoxin reductase
MEPRHRDRHAVEWWDRESSGSMDGPWHLTHDVVVVGGGPAGLSAALVLGRSRRRVIVLDGGQPRNAAARQVNGFLGHDGIAPHALRARGRSEVVACGVEVVDDLVTEAERMQPSDSRFVTGFRVQTRGGRTATCRKLLFATGMVDELPNFPGVRECYGVSVHHCPYCDGWEHRGQRLLAYGPAIKDAVGLALGLKCWSEQVTVLTGGRRLGDEPRDRLRRNQIAWCEERIVRLVYQGQQLTGVELISGQKLPGDALFCETVQRPACELPLSLGVTYGDTFTGRTDRKQKTNVPGLFIAGDADGDVQFAIVAAAEGATAAVAINRELLEEERQ